MAESLPHDHIVPYDESGDSKKKQVAEMFDKIAFRYDFLNRFLSGGIDIYWRKRAIAELKALKPELVLDVATGTGDMALLLSKYVDPGKIIGIDISEGMLEHARQKVEKQRVVSKNVKAFLDAMRKTWQFLPPHVVTSAVKKIGQR